MEGEVISGPWRATRLWNDVVRTFHAGMARRRHRRGRRTFDDCFSGAEAVDWLRKRMVRNPNFGPDVSKEQTAMLLQKMLRAGILAAVEDGEEGGDAGAGFGQEAFSQSKLYRFVECGVEGLRTPGKAKSGERRTELSRLDNTNTPVAPNARTQKRPSPPAKGESQALTEADKENLNRSYFHSLPANSLLSMGDSARAWESAFLFQLRSAVGVDVFALLPPVSVAAVVANMTGVSAKGVVQPASCGHDDLPHWVLSAMKCLANWPRPLRMASGEDSPLPSYPGFAQDVFGVVREYFLQTCRAPLIPYGLYHAFATVLARSEGRPVAATCARPAGSAPCYDTGVATSTPTVSSTSTLPAGPKSNNAFLLTGREQQYERVARIRQTLDVPVPANSSASFSSFDNSNSTMTSSGMSECQPQQQHPPPPRLHPGMSATAIMKSFLPPNSCFETAFMNERPVTRIVPQQGVDSLHLDKGDRRASYRNMTLLAAGQLSGQQQQEESLTARRQPRWRRTSRERQSIAVMDSRSKSQQREQRGPSPARSECTHSVRRQSLQPGWANRTSSADNLLDSGAVSFDPRGSRANAQHAPMQRVADSNVILSKAVRKEKRRQQVKREQRAHSADDHRHDGNVQPPTYHQEQPQPQLRYRSDRYRSLVVKTPVWVDARTGLPTDGSVRCVRAEPYRSGSAEGSSREELRPVSAEARESAARACQLLGLLLPPANRRKLQLLLKFIRRVASNQRLRLDAAKSNERLALEVLAPAILRPYDHLNHELYRDAGRRAVRFFVECYDKVWTPPEGLRREVEEKVYQSLVSKRLEAGEEPFPITFCRRVPSEVFEAERAPAALRGALHDLLRQIVDSRRMGEREKRKRLRAFRQAHPDVYAAIYPTEEDEPRFMREAASTSMSRLPSISKIRSALRI